MRLAAAHARNGPWQRERAVVIGGEQFRAVVGGQQLDPEGAGQRHEGEVNAVVLRFGGSQMWIVVRGVDVVVGFAGQFEHPSAQPG